jgi:uncharacterized protein CbrC (UPF0167 family)
VSIIHTPSQIPGLGTDATNMIFFAALCTNVCMYVGDTGEEEVADALDMGIEPSFFVFGL